LTVTTNGYVGIGTSAPTSTLHVVSSTDPVIQMQSPTNTYAGFLSINSQADWFTGVDPGAGPGSWDVYENSPTPGARLVITTTGNVGIGVTSPANPLQMASGAYCSEAGVWTSVSDRNVKENFTAISPVEVLDKVAAMPITQWKYKVEPSGTKHIGPVAQDFHSAFGLGESDRAIGSVDESGVALAAIQGLNQKLEDELKAKDAEIQALAQRLERLESKLAHSSNE
jgi:hypothetical protein